MLCLRLNNKDPPPCKNIEVTDRLVSDGLFKGFQIINALSSKLLVLVIILIAEVKIIYPEHQSQQLRLTDLSVPTVADPREPMTISCSFEMGGEELNSVKWYKDEQEFFGFMPTLNPSIRRFPVAGIHMRPLHMRNIYSSSESDNCSKSKCTVTLYNLTRLHSSGVYRCEISTDAPTFRVVFGSANVTVIAFPRSKPQIDGLSTFYNLGDFINGNCTSGPADPPPLLTWYLNGRPLISRALVGPTLISDSDSRGLVNTSLSIHLIAEKQHFLKSNMLMELTCVATSPMVPSYKQSSMNASVVIGLKGGSNYAQHLSDQKLARLGSGLYEIQSNITLEEDFLMENSFSTLFFDWLRNFCPALLQTNGFKQIESYPKDFFDAIIINIAINTECIYPAIKKLGDVPLIAASPFGLEPGSEWFTGDWKYPSIDPYFSTTYTDRMNFFQRFHNFILMGYSSIHRNILYRNTLNSLKQFYSEEELSVDLTGNFSLILANLNPNMEYPKPLPPNVIPVGGLHVKLQNNIPKDVQKWLDDAKEGVILFSLGTNLKSTKLSPQKLSNLIQVFKEMAPYKVLMKWESDQFPNKPDNILTLKWLPQYDILNHRNVKVLFSHGGLLSLQEAMFAGKPVLGMPFFLDQKYNLHRASEKGVALIADYENVEVEIIKEKLNQLLHNSTFKSNSFNLAKRVNDQPQTPLERGIFWIEYTLRHGHSPQLQLASLHQSFWEKYCLDVIGTILIIFYVMLKLVGMILTKIVKKCLFQGKSKKTRKLKTR